LGWAVLTLRPDNTSPTGVGVISSFFFLHNPQKRKNLLLLRQECVFHILKKKKITHWISPTGARVIFQVEK
jgi:hypothetical protein